MPQSQILAINELVPGQVQAFLTVNTAIAALEESINDRFSVGVTGASYTLAELDLVRYGVFRIASATVDAEFRFPTTVNTETTKRLVVVINDSAQTITLRTTGSGSTVSLVSGDKAIVYVHSTDVIPIAVTGATVPFTIGGFYPGVAPNNSLFVRYHLGEEINLPTDLVGSYFSVSVNPTVPVYLFHYKGATERGRTKINTSGVATTTYTDTSFAAGDLLRVVYAALEEGTIDFTSVADNGDTVTIDDGAGTTVFTFGTGGGQVAPGGSATASATNLQAAIEASPRNVLVSRTGSTLTITNLNIAGGGSITKSDADNDYTITQFAADTTATDVSFTLVGTRS